MPFCLVFFHYLFHSFLCLFGKKGLGQFFAVICYRRLRGMAKIGGVEAIVAQVVLYHFVRGEIERGGVVNQLVDGQVKGGFADLVLMETIAQMADGTNGKDDFELGIELL